MVTSPTSPVTYRPSPYELLCNAKIEINRKYLKSFGLEKVATEPKKRALPSQKENKTAGKKSSLGNVENAAVTPTRKTRPKQKCASTEMAMVKKKRMMAKQRHERKKLRATARAAAKEDSNAKLDEELEKLVQELEEPDIGVNCQKELMTLMVDKMVNNAAIKKLTMEEEESSAIGTTPSSASYESSSSSSSSFRLSSDDDDEEDCKMPSKPSPKLVANKATDTTLDGKNSPSSFPKKLGVVVTDEKKKKDTVESSSLSCGAISIGSNNDSYLVRMGPSAASTAEDGPLCEPKPLFITTNDHDNLIPRLQDGTRLIGLNAIPFNSSTFQDDDLEEMLLLVLSMVPSESATTATPTIMLEYKKKLEQLLLKLKLEVTTVVSDEFKSMIVRKAQQLKMPIDGEEGHRLVTNWLEILDNWRSDPQDNNFLQVIDCVQIQFEGVTWVARLERKIMDKVGLKYIPASVKRYENLCWRKSIKSEKKIGPPYRGCVWQIIQYHRSICKKVIQKSQKQQSLRTRRTAEEIEVARRQSEKKHRTPQEQRRK
ncbi:hypothetical protein ACA910_002877 [Epithemia clementina (nom. ined.)]